MSTSLREHVDLAGHNENDKLFWKLHFKKKKKKKKKKKRIKQTRVSYINIY